MPVDFRFFIASNVGVDSQKQNGALLIAACILAAIRLRGEPIVRSPKVMATLADFGAVGPVGVAEAAFRSLTPPVPCASKFGRPNISVLHFGHSRRSITAPAPSLVSVVAILSS